MAVRYVGTDIIHEYKGFLIKKVEKYYSQGTERYYLVNGKVFPTLKEAKKHIDKMEERK